jgi:hypothetical protein
MAYEAVVACTFSLIRLQYENEIIIDKVIQDAMVKPLSFSL